MAEMEDAPDIDIRDVAIELRSLTNILTIMQDQITNLHRDVGFLYNNRVNVDLQNQNVENLPDPRTMNNNANVVPENAVDINPNQLEDPILEDIYEENENDVNLSFNNNEDLVNMSRMNAPNVTRRVQRNSVSQQQQQQQKGRRQSILGKLDRLNALPDQNIKIYKNTPSFEFLKLSKLDVSSVLEFMAGIDLYQNRHRLSVPAATLISEDIKDKLLGINSDDRLSDMNFYALSNQPLIQLMQKALMPRNVTDFRKQLDRNLKFSLPKDHRPTVTNFFLLHQALLTYRVQFGRLYDFISEGNTVQNIPRVDSKDGGLLKIFVEKIPFGIGKRMLQNLNTDRYTDVDIFMDAFYEQLKALYKIAVDARLLNNILYDPTAVNSHAEKQYHRVQELTDPDHIGMVAQLLDNLESEEPADELSFISNSKPNSGGNTGNGSGHSSSAPKGPSACFMKAIEGECKKRDCTYSHEPDVLKNYLKDTMAKILRSPYYKPTGTPSILHRPQQRQSVLSQPFPPPPDLPSTSTPVLLNLNYSDPALAEVYRDGFLHSYPEVHNMSAMHREGSVLLPGIKRHVVHLGKCLFDSGALHASYISPKLVDKYRSVLGPYIMPISGRVTLGDASTSHNVSEMIPMKLRFMDDNGLEHIGTVNLVSFESGSHVIVGLPDILRTFGTLFLHMIQTAMKDPSLLQNLVVRRPSVQALSFSSVGFHSFHDELDTFPTFDEDDQSSDSQSIQSFFNDDVNSSYDSDDEDMSIVVEEFDNLSEPEYFMPEGVVPDGYNAEDSDSWFERFGDTYDLDFEEDNYDSDEASESGHDGNINVSSATSTTQPWTFTHATAPEDDCTLSPCSFTYVLDMMDQLEDTGREAVVQSYLDLLDTHVHPEFAARTNIMELLRTKGLPVFIPRNWAGINGIPPVDIEWLEGMPAIMKPSARPVNPRLYENAKKEYERLLTYFYMRCDGPIASPLVVAPKATAPFIRLCGDYTAINKYIQRRHTPIPHVQLTISEKLVHYSVYADVDMTNSFHQFPLSYQTSMRLSIQTPWGQVRPLFVPEGIPIGSGILQQEMSELFRDFSEWCIVIFDNILILANDYEELFARFDRFLSRCVERNVTMKMAKTWLGFNEVKFFGYSCQKGSYCLTEDRKEALEKIPFPTNTKAMQSFIGFALFFKPFMSNYSILAAPLNDMVHKDFDWDPKTWQVDYRQVFLTFKHHCNTVMGLHYNDPAKAKLVRPDAAEKVGVGATLMQERLLEDRTVLLEPVLCASAKFSDAATRWTTIEQECYAVYFAVKTFSYFLYGVVFVIETDHNNLRWMEQSQVPKIIRWCAYLQSFQFAIRHIPGKKNFVADFLSRVMVLFYQYEDDEAEDIGWDMNEECQFHSGIEDVDTGDDPVDRILKACHNSRVGHFGARRTYNMANKLFPGHNIPINTIREFVSACVICQKYRLGMIDNIKPVVRHLKPPHHRSVIGIDTLEISPRDKFGNLYLDVIVNHFTKLVKCYPKGDKGAVSSATSLFQYMCSYGLFDVIISDPGSDFKSEVFGHLVRWFGLNHFFSLVDRHESNGVEGSNKQILRHIRALVGDERVKDEWSAPTILPIVEYLVNSYDSSETGIVPLQATFGSQDAVYLQLPESADPKVLTHSYVLLLDANLKHLREVSKAFQDQLVAERIAETPVEIQNKFQRGDFVFYQIDTDKPRPNKLAPEFLGPFEVIVQVKNDVEVRDLIYGHTKFFPVDRLKPFIGTKEAAFALAQRDADQYLVNKVLAYRGNPKVRTTMEFEILFADGSVVWLPYTQDIFQMEQYAAFCMDTPGLYFLQYTVKVAQQAIQQLNKQPITLRQPGDVIYVDIRTFGEEWYQASNLPDLYRVRYVDAWTITGWKKEPYVLYGHSDIFKKYYILKHDGVLDWARWTVLTNDMVLLNMDHLQAYPNLLH